MEYKKCGRKEFLYVRLLFLLSWDKWLKKSDEDRKRLCLEYVEKQFKAGNIFVGIDSKNEVCSYLIYSIQWNTLHIDDIYIDESCRNKGVATELIKMSFDEAKKLKCEVVNADCDVDNKEIIKLNEKMGFERLGEIKGFWDKDNIFFQKKIKT